jgi:hypothetical protein
MDNSLSSILSEEATETETETVASLPETAERTEAEHVEEVTGEETAPPAEAQKDDPLEKHRKGLEAAATAERKRRQDAEARADAAERRARELEQQHQRAVQQQTQQVQTGQEPTREQFATDAEYVRALVRHERETQRAEEQRQAEVEQQQRHEYEVRVKSEKVIAEASAIPGFNLAEFANVPVSQPMMDAILESEMPGKLVHFLQTQPEEAKRIADMQSPARQIAALARIEDKLSAEPEETREKPQLPKTLTQARNAQGQFEPAYSGPTPLNAILATK